MTLKPLIGDAFPLASVGAAQAPHMVERGDMLIELDEELDKRLRVYPAQVARGTMTQDASDRHLALWRAIVADHHRGEAAIARLMRRPYAIDAAPLALDWDGKVRELRRELAMRRNAYPKWIASPTNPLTAPAAARKLAAIDAVHWRYWMELYCFSDAPRETDLRRHAHAAEREADVERDAWAAARAEGGAAAALANRLASHWSAIAALGWHIVNGGDAYTAFAESDLARLASTANGRLQLLVDGPADPRADARIAQLAPLCRLLDRLAPVRLADHVYVEPLRRAA